MWNKLKDSSQQLEVRHQTSIKVLIISSYEDTLTAVRPEGEMLIAAHQTARVSIDIMTQADAPFVRYFRAAGMKVIDFHPTKKFDRKAVQFIRHILLQGKYDILHLFNNKAIVNGIRASRGLPHQVLTYRGVVGNTYWYDPTAYLNHLHPRVNGITALSNAARDFLQGQTWLSKDKIITVPKGQNKRWFEQIKAADLSLFNISKNAIIIACVANVRKVKGVPDLIKATYLLPTHREWHILLIGKGMDAPALQKLMNVSPSHIHFHLTGFSQNVPELVAACDLYVQPSLMEGLGKSVQEAMMLKTPVVVTAVGGMLDLVKDQKTGLLALPNSPQSLATKINELADNEWLRRSLAEAAYMHMAEQFSVEVSGQKLVSAYEYFISH